MLAITTDRRHPVTDASLVPEARRAAEHAAFACGLPKDQVGSVALAATELAENLHRHAVGGELLLLEEPGRLRIVALDRGPGVAQFDRCLEDGYSTAGSMGTGLGAVRRIADEFDAFSEPGRGTVVVAGFGARTSDPDLDVAGVGFPIEGELANGDAWAVDVRGDLVTLLLADGLGHGDEAAVASRYACEALPDVAGLPLDTALRRLDDRVRGSRGAAVTMVAVTRDVLRDGGEILAAGLGNVACMVSGGPEHYRRLVTANGTVGGLMPRTIPVRGLELGPRGLIVLHTDGLHSRVDLTERQALMRRSSVLIATALWRDYRRNTDDTGILVARSRGRDE